MSKSEDIRNLLSSAGVTDEAQVNEIVNKANEVEQSRSQQEENLKKDLAMREKLVGGLRSQYSEQMKLFELEKLAADAALQTAKDTLKLEMDSNTATEETIRLAQLVVDNAEEELENATNLASSSGPYAAIRDRLEAITGVSDAYKNTAWFQMIMDPGNSWKAAKDHFGDIGNMAGSMVQKSIQATVAFAVVQDAAVVSFNKSTGASKEFGQQLIDLNQDMFQYGVSIEDASATMTSLVTNVYTFGEMSKKTQEDLAKTTALLDNMGVNADDTAQNLQFLTQAMGVSGEAAAEMQREMFVVAQELGRPPAEMSKAFNSAKGTMAKFGKSSDAVFKKLYINASKAGMEVGQVLSIVEKFDQFDSAAESVGKLNAILGGPFLNSMEMVTTTDPTERMKMLSDSVAQAGVSFDDMGYYQRKALTEAMGLKDVSELALVMAGDFDTMGTGAQKSQAELVELAKQSADFTTVLEELKEMGRMLVMQVNPLIQTFKSVLSVVQKLTEWIPGLSYAIFGVSLALTVYAAKQKLATMATVKFNWAFAKGPGAIIVALAMGIGLLTQANPLMKGLGVAILFATVAVWAFNSGLFALNVMTGGVIAVIGVILTLFVVLISWLFQKDVGASTFLEGLVKIGHAFMAIGLGVIFAAQGLWMLLPALVALFMMTGPLLLMLVPGGAFWSLSTGIGWVADAFERLDTTKITALTSLFAALAEVTKESAENIMTMGKGIGLMSAGFAVMAVNPVALAAVPLMLAGAPAVATLAGGTLTGKGLPGGKAGGKTEKLLPLTVKVELEGKELGKFVKDIVVKQLNYNQG